MAKKRAAKRRVPQYQIMIPLDKTKMLGATETLVFKSVVALMSSAALRIANKIIAKVDLTIQASGMQVAAGSYDLWRPELAQSIKNNLMLNAPWDAPTEAAVLGVATDMGTIAVILSRGSNQVARTQIHAAFNAVSKAHAICSNAMGGGTWCNFEMS